MHAHHIERVVHVEAELERDREGADRTDDETGDDRAERVDLTTGRGDGDHPRDGGGDDAHGGDLAGTPLLHQRPGDHGARGPELGVDEGRGGGALVRQRGTGVEAEPAEPEQAHADDHERNVVGALLAAGEVPWRAQHEGDRETGDPGVEFHRQAAGEVEGAEVLHDPAVGVEHPVGDGDVDDEQPQHDEDEPPLHRGAVRDRSADQGHRDDGEAHLEGAVDVGGDRSGQRVQLDVVHEHVIEVPDEPGAADVRAEREGVSDDPPGEGAERQRGEAHLDHHEHVAGAPHAAVEEG